MIRYGRSTPIACAAVGLYALPLLVWIGDAPLALLSTLPLCVALAILVLAKQRDMKLFAFALLGLLWVSGAFVMLRSWLAFGGPGHLAVLFLPLLNIVLLLGAMIGMGLVAGLLLLASEVGSRLRRCVGTRLDRG